MDLNYLIMENSQVYFHQDQTGGKSWLAKKR